VEVAERFRALIPSAELITIANCGHAPMLEQPLMFNAIVEDWLHRHARPSRPGPAMIARLGGAALDAAVAWRRRGFERLWRQPMIVQERSLLTAVAAARNTDFGLAHDFDRVRSIDDYRRARAAARLPRPQALARQRGGG